MHLVSQNVDVVHVCCAVYVNKLIAPFPIFMREVGRELQAE